MPKKNKKVFSKVWERLPQEIPADKSILEMMEEEAEKDPEILEALIREIYSDRDHMTL